MILEIDAGNSRLKWRWRGSAASSAGGREQLESALEHASRPERVLIGNVRGAGFEREIAGSIGQRWQLRPTFARVARACGGVRVQYPRPAELGVDRWLAMLAGYRRARGGCLVADLGTALTIDVLDRSGLHLGGYIMPGLAAAEAGLLQATAIEMPPAREPAAIAPGNDTGAAVRNGALFMLCSAVREALARLEHGHGKSMLILTGGGADALARELAPIEAVIVPELVLDGLAIACDESGA